MTDKDLKALERRTFRTVTDDGLWDVLIAEVFAMFAVAPLLSEALGDFWSSAIFLPIWVATYLTIRAVRLRVVTPRVGTVRFGPDRRRQLRQLSYVMLAVNVIAAILGVVAAIGVQMDWLGLSDGSIGYPLGLGIVVLVGFSGAASVTGTWRYCLSGVVRAVAPLVGGWLWRNALGTPDGFPIVFGVASGIILVTGIVRFSALLRSHQLPQHDATV